MIPRPNVVDLRQRYLNYLDRCNEHRFETLGNFVALDVNGPGEGLARYITGLQDVVRAFPDYQWIVQDVLVDGDRLAARLTGSGTHSGAPFRGIATTGRRLRTMELALYRFRDGLIQNCWGDLGSTVRDALVSAAT